MKYIFPITQVEHWFLIRFTHISAGIFLYINIFQTFSFLQRFFHPYSLQYNAIVLRPLQESKPIHDVSTLMLHSLDGVRRMYLSIFCQTQQVEFIPECPLLVSSDHTAFFNAFSDGHWQTSDGPGHLVA